MKKRTKRPAARQSNQIGVSLGIVGCCVVAAMVFVGCPQSMLMIPQALRGSPELAEGANHFEAPAALEEEKPADVLTKVANDESQRDNIDELLELALANVNAEPTDELGSRMAVREINMPRPPRGSNARFNFEGGRRGWITALPSKQLLTSPAYGQGKVFLGGGFSSTQFFAFNAFTGEMDWALRAPDGGPTAAIVKDEWVIFNTESCTIFVADARSGQLLWSRWLGDPLMSQAVAAGELVFSAYPKSGGYEFGAFRLTDGEPVWQRSIPADVIQAPQAQGDSLYFATMDGTAMRLRQSDGAVVWSRDVSAASAVWVDEDDNVMLSRRVGNGRPQEQMIVLAAANGRLQNQGDRFDAPYFSGNTRDRQMMSGQAGAWGTARSGSRLGLNNVASGWAFQGSSPAVDNGRAYFAVGGEIRARDTSNGETVWRRAYASAGNAQAVSPPAVVGAQIIFGTVDGHLYSADIDTGMTLWAYDVGEPIQFQPIVAQGWVYVATAEGNLIGLEVSDPEFDGWHMWGGNAQHAGMVDGAGTADRFLLASLERPSEGTMRRLAFETPDGSEGTETATDTPPAPVWVASEGRAMIPVDPDEAEIDLPLTHTEVEADISGVVARVVVTQQFRNPHDRPIEAVYMFPLPQDAAVDDMEMQIGERVIRAEIQRRAQARRTYTEARASGRRAALLEQQRPNLFSQRVANIQPGEQIDVRIRYVQMLPFADGSYEFTFPMVAPRRYDPANPNPLSARPDELAPNTEQGEAPAVAASLPELRSSADVGVTVNLAAGLPVSDITSPTHDVEVEQGGGDSTRITLAASDQIPNRDLVIRYDISGEVPRAAVYSHHGDDGGYLSLVVQPPDSPEDASIARRNFTFVVDSSSSMAGRPMAQAQAVMGELLSGLRPTDTFNILRFSDEVESLGETALSGSEEDRARGEAYIASLHAVGATEMVPAIEAGLGGASSSDDGDELDIVVLVTDGYIANEAEVLRTIAANLGDSRLYGLGVGSSVNRFLLERVAEMGRGRAIVATLSEEPEAVAERFASFVDRPVFTNVTVDFGELDISDVYPRRVPDLFAGRPLVLQGRFDEGGTATVRVRGDIGGQRYERAVEVQLPSTTSEAATSVHGTLWARAAVHDRMNRLYLRDDPTLIEEVTDIGLAHRMVTQWTSFVAVDERPANEEEDADEDETDENSEAEGAEGAGDGEGGDGPRESMRATLSPARSLPGDPEIRIPAPRDALAVTVILPFGETLDAEWEEELGLWSARFLIPRDAEEGVYPVRIIISLANGRQERLALWYTVDSEAPLVDVEVAGEIRPGSRVTLRARQVITEADLAQVGWTQADLSRVPARAQILSDARRVQIAPPGGAVIDLGLAGPGVWEATWTVPADTEAGRLQLLVVVADVAANIRTQHHTVEVVR